MIATYLPLIAVPALALVVALRRPPEVSSGRAPVTIQLVRAAVAAALLVACGWIVIVAASYVREWGCPGGFDLAGKCVESAAWDLGPAGVMLLALPLAAGVALALAPARLEGKAAPTPKARRAPVAQPAASDPPRAQTEGSADTSARGAAAPQAPTADLAPPPPAEVPADERLEGAVERSLVSGKVVPLMHAMRAATGRIGQRPGVVFSPFANNEANAALAELATHLDARRYLGMAPDDSAATAPNVVGARRLAGSGAAHASELALDLAGGAIDSLILLDGRVELSPLALAALGRVGSLCIADEHGDVSRAVDIILPAPPFAIDGGRVDDADTGQTVDVPSDSVQRCARAGMVERLRVALGGTERTPVPPSFVPPLKAPVPPLVSTPSTAPKVPVAPVAPPTSTPSPAVDALFSSPLAATVVPNRPAAPPAAGADDPDASQEQE